MVNQRNQQITNQLLSTTEQHSSICDANHEPAASMIIHRYSCLAGARAARGLVVIIDVFRASNTIIALLEAGAAFVWPIGELGEAFRLKEANPEYLLLGERGGLPPPGFEGGNSPARVADFDVQGRGVILTTSAGSQGIVHAAGAEEILIGSFANLSALVAHIERCRPRVVTLVPMGLEGREPAEEDEACSDCLSRALQGETYDFPVVRQALLSCSGAARLRRLGQDEDLDWCLTLDRSAVVPAVEQGRLVRSGHSGSW